MREVAHTLKSAHLGNERIVWVQTPEDEQTPAALIVFLDGEFYREHVAPPAALAALIETGAIPPALVAYVSIESMDARWCECPCHPPFARFVADELMPRLAAEHPVINSLQSRVLVGLSYTGLAASFVAWRVPGLFNPNGFISLRKSTCNKITACP
ncbi:MAG: hypothetical protein IT582_06355 [Opitutaceae bacterium]|nr:hypothetical protein [Opitutaceae bacterium]